MKKLFVFFSLCFVLSIYSCSNTIHDDMEFIEANESKASMWLDSGFQYKALNDTVNQYRCADSAQMYIDTAKLYLSRAIRKHNFSTNESESNTYPY